MSPMRRSKRKTKLPNSLKDTDYEHMKKNRSDKKSDDTEIEEDLGRKGENKVDDCVKATVIDEIQKEVVEGMESGGNSSMGDKGDVGLVEFPTLGESMGRKVDSMSNDASKQGNGSTVEKSGDQLSAQKMIAITEAMTTDSTVSNTVSLSICNNELSNNTKNFVDVVKPKLTEYVNKLNLIPVEIEDGREVVVFDEELVEEGSRKWRLTLCGHFVGCKMSYYELKRDPEVLPCWIKLHNVPVEAWTVKGISAIASSLASDGTGNIGFARVLVEIKVDRAFKEKTEICYKGNGQVTKSSKFVDVEYSWKPPRCSHCKVYGHTDSTCGTNVRNGDGNSVVGDLNNAEKGANNSDGFQEVKQGNGKNGAKMSKGFQGNKPRMEYKPVMKKKYSAAVTQTQKRHDEEANKKENKDAAGPSSHVTPKSPWKVDKSAIEELKRSANKYAVLDEIEENEIYGTKWKDSIDKGMCNKEMQKYVKNFIRDENLHICATIKTHVKEKQIGRICKQCCVV
ncbi:DUF4283 domain-containing protein [Artemisia annua]|uniref:DUF4283 domain-containing protein n=1 Tax=Artemisia annua TaxID=35608 RepID=A0A2U1LGF3_ARTAN|nr:DUF4283 domain-containing protein [Artemisia annua]